MEEKKPLVTKEAALDRFITERLMGDRGFSIKARRCSYSHKLNGGCEIGQYLPKDVAERMFDGSTAKAIEVLAAMQGVFEDPESDFWIALQRCHDFLALASDKGRFSEDTRYNSGDWEAFQSNLEQAVTRLVGAGA